MANVVRQRAPVAETEKAHDEKLRVMHMVWPKDSCYRNVNT